MIEKGFIKGRKDGPGKVRTITSVLNRIFLYLGVLAIVFALIMILLNLNKADQYAWFWLPLVIAGIVMVFAVWLQSKKREDRR